MEGLNLTARRHDETADHFAADAGVPPLHMREPLSGLVDPSGAAQ